MVDLSYTKEQLKNTKPVIETLLGERQKLCLERNVVFNWKVLEKLEGMYRIKFQYHPVNKTDNIVGGYSHYQIEENAKAEPVLVRVSE